MMNPNTVTALTNEVDTVALVRSIKKLAEKNSRAFADAQTENAKLQSECRRLEGNCQELKAAVAALSVTLFALLCAFSI